jgi:hypothetical protein
MTTAMEQLSNDWWTLKELAARWRCSEDTIIRRVTKGELKGKKLGGWKFHRRAVEAFERGALPAADRGRARFAPVEDELGLYAGRNR